MKEQDAKQFWSSQTDSRHRHNTPAFYAKKADEHAAVFRPQDRQQPVIDLGCGAGELLLHLKQHIPVAVGLDYSESMLAEARKRNPDIEFVAADFEHYVAGCRQPVWMATGAVNQYIGADGQRRVLDHFRDNEASRSIYLFDNVDPVRYWMTSRSRVVDYLSGAPVSRLRLLYALARIAYGGLLMPRALDVVNLGTRMGYGYRPAFWIRECEARGLAIEVISSRYYEYRYHLIIHKP